MLIFFQEGGGGANLTPTCRFRAEFAIKPSGMTIYVVFIILFTSVKQFSVKRTKKNILNNR